jgi:hypothetical protein
MTSRKLISILLNYSIPEIESALVYVKKIDEELSMPKKELLKKLQSCHEAFSYEELSQYFVLNRKLFSEEQLLFELKELLRVGRIYEPKTAMFKTVVAVK